jgi:pimeloyl-ACP methyl ester carboxylesterase
MDGVEFEMVKTNGVTLRVAEAGPKDGPLILLVHGWPESWYSWRHQISVLAAAGYRVVAPDMRGYGGSDRPDAVEAYDIHQLSGDLVGLLDAMGRKTAIIAGHDWGAAVAWNSVLLHPDRFTALAAMSVPYGGRGAVRPTDGMRQANGENFFYMLYHQELDANGRGVADAEYDADPRGLLLRLYGSTNTPLNPPTVTDPKRAAGGWIPRLGEPKQLPAWLSEAELAYFVEEFRRAGFRGGVNYYRNIDRNWETTPQLTGAKIAMPVMFVAGAQDLVIRGASAEQLTAMMSRTASDLRSVTVVPGAGHWIQQEKPEEVNALLMAFLKGL